MLFCAKMSETFSDNINRRGPHLISFILLLGLISVVLGYCNEEDINDIKTLRASQVARIYLWGWTERTGHLEVKVLQKDSIERIISLFKRCGEDGSRINARANFGAYNVRFVKTDSTENIDLHLTDTKYDGGIMGYGSGNHRCDDVVQFVKQAVQKKMHTE